MTEEILKQDADNIEVSARTRLKQLSKTLKCTVKKGFKNKTPEELALEEKKEGIHDDLLVEKVFYPLLYQCFMKVIKMEKNVILMSHYWSKWILVRMGRNIF